MVQDGLRLKDICLVNVRCGFTKYSYAFSENDDLLAFILSTISEIEENLVGIDRVAAYSTLWVKAERQFKQGVHYNSTPYDLKFFNRVVDGDYEIISSSDLLGSYNGIGNTDEKSLGFKKEEE